MSYLINKAPEKCNMTMAWKNNDNLQRIFMYPIEKDGVIYFMTFNYQKNDDHCVYGAYDTKTESLLWQWTSQKLTGFGNNNMYILGDKLYVLEEEAQGCYNKKDGSVIWEHRMTIDEMKKNVGIGASQYSMGITYCNGKFYFTSSGGYLSSEMTGIDESLIKNIQCIDAETGTYLWGDLPEGSGSLDTSPIVIDNQCFVVGWDNLRVYNATTGKLIGVDNSVKSLGNELNAEYDGMFIYFNADTKTKTSKLIAIKPYW